MEAVEKYQAYKGKRTANGSIVAAVIFGPADGTKIDAFVKAHFKPGALIIRAAINSVDEYEPWVLCSKKFGVLPQRFTEAFPKVK